MSKQKQAETVATPEATPTEATPVATPTTPVVENTTLEATPEIPATATIPLTTETIGGIALADPNVLAADKILTNAVTKRETFAADYTEKMMLFPYRKLLFPNVDSIDKWLVFRLVNLGVKLENKSQVNRAAYVRGEIVSKLSEALGYEIKSKQADFAYSKFIANIVATAKKQKLDVVALVSDVQAALATEATPEATPATPEAEATPEG